MRLAIIGVGGMGGYYAARLQRAGHPVTLVARGGQLTALQSNGLRVEHPEFRFSEPVTAMDMPGLCDRPTGDFDGVMVATKSAATAEIVEALRRWFDASGARLPVVSLQSGVDNEASLASALGEDAVLGALALRISTQIAAPGVIEASGPGEITAGLWPSRDAAAEGPAAGFLPQLLGALQESGVPVRESPEIQRDLWRKLVLTNGMDPLAAVTGWDTERLSHDERMAPMLRRLLHEAATAAQVDGVAFGEDEVDEIFWVIHELQANKAPMLVDREQGRPLELDAICGAVVRRNQQLGASTGATEMLWTLLDRGIWAER